MGAATDCATVHRQSRVRLVHLQDSTVLEITTSDEGFEVPAVCLDELRIPIGAEILLKVDVEGHEAAVLKGATKLLRPDHQVLAAVIEYNHDTDVLHVLRGAGFELFMDQLDEAWPASLS